MNTDTSHPEKRRVVVVGGGVAALETTLALSRVQLGDHRHSDVGPAEQDRYEYPAPYLDAHDRETTPT